MCIGEPFRQLVLKNTNHSCSSTWRLEKGRQNKATAKDKDFMFAEALLVYPFPQFGKRDCLVPLSIPNHHYFSTMKISFLVWILPDFLWLCSLILSKMHILGEAFKSGPRFVLCRQHITMSGNTITWCLPCHCCCWIKQLSKLRGSGFSEVCIVCLLMLLAVFLY